MRHAKAALALVVVTVALLATPVVLPALEKTPPDLRHAQVWMPTDIPSMDIKAGPANPDSIYSGDTVRCQWVYKKMSGLSPKFACRVGEDEIKVKYGFANGEVQGEVAATRLLWALGFGADQMYPVKVICAGCPKTVGGILQTNGERIVDPAAMEWKMPGKELSPWSWKELDMVDDSVGGAPRAHRDGLKLLAIFLQHTDSKSAQQRLICLDQGRPAKGARCESPFMLIQDAGLTFGRANTFNANPIGAMNLTGWSSTPVWKPGTDKCIGNLPKSYTGTLDEPVISEEGRQFLAALLGQLTNQQLAVTSPRF